MAFITVRRSRRTNYIGIPGTSTFGVGLADEKDYTAVGLKPTAHCFDTTDFQYGQYYFGEDTSQGVGTVDMKWIPKFYIKQLQKNEGTVNLDDGELEALLPYVEVTKEQMKEAQRRSPHNALVVAPADRFANEADANAHGFYLMRGFIDGGKEYNGFFIANALTTYGNVGSKYFLCLGQREYKSTLTKYNSILRNDADLPQSGMWPNPATKGSIKGMYIKPLMGTSYQCASIMAYAVIAIISLIQGQYATSTEDCAWYDKNLLTNYPKGINKNGVSDVDDSSVNITPGASNVNAPVVALNGAHSKTTHNGAINGITNVNGWSGECLIGCTGDCATFLRKDKSIYDITYNNVDQLSSDIYETAVVNINSYWGGSKSSLPDLAGTNAKLFGVYSFGDATSDQSAEFGSDDLYAVDGTMIFAGGYWTYNSNAGIFYRSTYSWASTGSYFSFRAMAYPRQQI